MRRLLRSLPALPLLVALLAAATPRAQDPSPSPTSPAALTLPAFTGYAHPDADAIERNANDGSVPRCAGKLTFYVRIATPGDLSPFLSRLANAPAQQLHLAWFEHPGDRGGETTCEAPASTAAGDLSFGTWTLPRPGTYRLELTAGDGSDLHQLAALHLRGPAAAGAQANTAERRNASSVHLGYDIPRESRDDVQWFYCELTARTDPLWTYYMATGWQRGYFGMQVNSATERRVIFSVWDAGNEATDRSKVGDDDRVQLVAKGEGVVAEGFGHEGTGGHSHVVQDWHVGETCRFLLHARLDGTHTIYTGWFRFGDATDWTLVASFRAPKDGQLLRGLYSFAENFSGANGDARRECEYGNLWLGTAGGAWLPVTSAKFSHDATGDTIRLDRGGGVREDRFFLAHGDFAVATTRGGTRFTLAATPQRPTVLDQLPTPPQ